MESKICNCCGIEKQLDKFVKTNYSSGYGKQCKECSNAKQREQRKASGDANTKKYEKTPNGYLMRTYRNMLSRVKGILKHKAHLYEGLEILERKEFYDWAKNSEEFKTLFNIWVASDYAYRCAPSVDRIESDKGYTLDNMRWLPHWKNSQLGNYSRQGKYK